MAIPHQLRGQDLVLAAETGSGKTMCYLVPLIAHLRAMASLPDSQPGRALVLCPNGALCDQVVAAANSICDAEGIPLIATSYVASSRPPPFSRVDLVVSTPTGLINLLSDSNGAFGLEWSPQGFIATLTHLIMDESDLLLSGSYERDMRFLLGEIRNDDRAYVAATVEGEMGLTPDSEGDAPGGGEPGGYDEVMDSEQEGAVFRDLPFKLRKLAYRGGILALDAAGYPLPPTPQLEELRAEHPEERTEEPTRLPDRYRKRQYVFVGATLPTGGKKSVAADIKYLVPGALFMQGPGLHTTSPRLELTWLAADDATWDLTLAHVVAEDADRAAGRGRMLVFASSVTAADRVAEVLRTSGVEVMLYHKGVPAADRAAALRRMSEEEGGVLVATDAAARGIDIPAVTHVVQADFASCAIDFLHRVGRTGRAGRTGRVTNIIQPAQRELAAEIKKAVDEGRPVEGVFSRNRSFRKKIRKHGSHQGRETDDSYYTTAASSR